MTNTSDVVVVAPPAPVANVGSYLEWGAVLGGAALATVVTAILTTFGSAIGLTLVSAESGQTANLWVIVIVAGLWAIWLTICANFAGGYLAGRMRRPAHDASAHEREVRDGAHGVVMWAVGALIVICVAASGLAGAARTAASGLSAVASSATEALSAQVNPLDRAVDMVTRTTGQAPLSEAERAETSRILLNALSTGEIPEADRAYVASRIAQRTGVAEPDAQKQVDQAYAQLQQAQETARQAAEQARRTGIISAFLTAAAMLLGGAVAWFAAQLGGRHRDEDIDVKTFFS